MTRTAQPPPMRFAPGVETEHRETHISWVLLTPDRAYKRKKPLVLPYLDYGTPARRLAMCRAEVELNRRLAPQLYLGVRSLVPRSGGGLALSDEDDLDAVDYVVEMRRYPETATLAAGLAAGKPGSAELAGLGERLARFHAEAAISVRADGAEAVKRALDDNFASLKRLTRAGVDRDAVDRAERFAAAFLASAWDELDRRAASGCVRDGHGDLRLEHVVREDELEIVDCVEFNAELRRIDVAADLAFLVMELHEAGRPELAALLVRDYREAGGDPGSDALLAFFAGYRAQVRAKVALTRASQLQPGGERRADELSREHTLLRLGERLGWAARTPLVIAVAGLSASGKSTVARALAEVSGFVHLNSDVLRKQQAGLQPTERAPLELYHDDVSRRTYTGLARAARATVADGVIVDATFRRRADRDAFRAALGDAVPMLVVECRAPADVLRARARRRRRDPSAYSDAGEQVVDEQLAHTEPFDDVPPATHVALRSDRPVAEIVGDVADALDRRLLSRRSTESGAG